jgi:hypothetical protein
MFFPGSRLPAAAGEILEEIGVFRPLGKRPHGAKQVPIAVLVIVEDGQRMEVLGSPLLKTCPSCPRLVLKESPDRWGAG